jgi:hypothetical protein
VMIEWRIGGPLNRRGGGSGISPECSPWRAIAPAQVRRAGSSRCGDMTVARREH